MTTDPTGLVLVSANGDIVQSKAGTNTVSISASEPSGTNAAYIELAADFLLSL